MDGLNLKAILAGLILALSLAGCGANNNGDNHDGNAPCDKSQIACPMIYGPVCVETSGGSNCYEANSCIADAGCETILCHLDLDTTGTLDPNSDCAKAHPSCLNPCPNQ